MATQLDNKKITVHDKNFEIFISKEEIDQHIRDLAAQIDVDYYNKKLLVIGILNGAFMFVSDLIKEMTIDPEISFIKLTSYTGTSTTGNVQQLIGLKENIEGRHVLVLEDIVDTGNTLEKILEVLKSKNPASLEIGTLLYKPDAYKKDYAVKYVGRAIPNKFVVGYGLDYDGYGRSLQHIYQIV